MGARVERERPPWHRSSNKNPSLLTIAVQLIFSFVSRAVGERSPATFRYPSFYSLGHALGRSHGSMSLWSCRANRPNLAQGIAALAIAVREALIRWRSEFRRFEKVAIRLETGEFKRTLGCCSGRHIHPKCDRQPNHRLVRRGPKQLFGRYFWLCSFPQLRRGSHNMPNAWPHKDPAWFS